METAISQGKPDVFYINCGFYSKKVYCTHQLPLGFSRGISYSDQKPVDHLYSSFIINQRRFIISHQGHFSRQLRVLANFANRNCHYCHSRCVHITYPRLKMLWFFFKTPSKITIACDIQGSKCSTSNDHTNMLHFFCPGGFKYGELIRCTYLLIYVIIESNQFKYF